MLGNSEIRFLYNDAINIYNKSTLPIEVKRLIAECILHQIEKQADNAINEELNPPKDILYGTENENGSITLEQEVQDGITKSLS